MRPTTLAMVANPQLTPMSSPGLGRVGVGGPTLTLNDIDQAELWLARATQEISGYSGTYSSVQSASQSVNDLQQIISGAKGAPPINMPLWGAVVGDVNNLFPANTPGDQTLRVALWATQPPPQSLTSGPVSYPAVGSGLQTYPQAFLSIKSLLEELRQLRASAAAVGVQMARMQAEAAGAAQAAGMAQSALQKQLQTANAAAAIAAAACLR